MKLSAQINGLLAPVEVKATVTATRPEPEEEMTEQQMLDELDAIEKLLRSAGRRPALPVKSAPHRVLQN